MIFDDVKPPSDSAGSASRHRRRSPRRDSNGSSRRRRRSSFESASRLSSGDSTRSDRSATAWLWMLGFLVLAALGFGFFLQEHKGAMVALPGERPSSRLVAFIDPVLAPLETGSGGYDTARLADLSEQFAGELAAVGIDDREIFTTAGTVSAILQEAAADRARHLQRLVDLGSPVIGLSEGGAPANPAMTETARRHHELAVDVSWQRNSGTYRNRIDELMARLSRMEQGRFTGVPRPASSPVVVPHE